MVKIASYVFFDIETTGLPHQERYKTKITELSFVAVLRKDLEKAVIGKRAYVSKLTLLFNPQRKINPKVCEITGLTNEMLKNEPIFKDKVHAILTFLRKLPEPVCLIAHNGNNFDYKILLAEFMDINISLPKDLLCVDSLVGFRKLHKEKYRRISPNNSFEDSKGSEDWPDFNISTEEWNEIDILCSSLSDIEVSETSQGCTISSQSSNNSMKSEKKVSFKLTDLYRRLVRKDVINSHRAEDDCMMLLECVVAAKEFLIWTDKYCQNIHNIKPFERR